MKTKVLDLRFMDDSFKVYDLFCGDGLYKIEKWENGFKQVYWKESKEVLKEASLFQWTTLKVDNIGFWDYFKKKGGPISEFNNE